MWFLTADPVVCIPMILTEFPKKVLRELLQEAYTLTSKSTCLTCNVASSLVCTSPLAVITVVELLDVLLLSNSAKLKSRLPTICILALESTRNSLFSDSFCAGSSHFSAGEQNVALLFFFELVYVFGKIPNLALGTSFLSFSLFMGPVNKFHGVGTLLMLRFDLYFSKRWSFLSQDTRMT